MLGRWCRAAWSGSGLRTGVTCTVWRSSRGRRPLSSLSHIVAIACPFQQPLQSRSRPYHDNIPPMRLALCASERGRTTTLLAFQWSCVSRTMARRTRWVATPPHAPLQSAPRTTPPPAFSPSLSIDVKDDARRAGARGVHGHDGGRRGAPPDAAGLLVLCPPVRRAFSVQPLARLHTHLAGATPKFCATKPAPQPSTPRWAASCGTHRLSHSRCADSHAPGL
jgi:hypothetical protein